MFVNRSQRHWRLVALIGLAILSFVLGVVGFLGVAIREIGSLSGWDWLDATYKTVLLFLNEYQGPDAVNEIPPALQLARVGAMASVLWGVWMAGISLLGERLLPLRLRWRPADVAFCGSAPELLNIARDFRRQHRDKRILLVVGNAGSPIAQQFRDELSGLVVAEEPSASVSTASLDRVKGRIYAAGNADDETLRIVRTIIRRESGDPLPSVPIEVTALLHDGAVRRTLPPSFVDVDRRCIDLAWVVPAELAVRALLQRISPDESPAKSHPRLHVLLLGSDTFAEALVLQIARNAYPRTAVTRITVVAPDASEFVQRVCMRYPALATDYQDRQLFGELHPLLDLKPLVRTGPTLSTADLEELERDGPISCAYVRGDDDVHTHAACLRLRQLRARCEGDFRIGAYFEERSAAAKSGAEESISADRDVFHIRSGEAYLGQHLDQLAVLYNYAYDNAVPAPEASEAEHNAARLRASEAWKSAQEWKRESSRHVADHVDVKLRAMGLEKLVDPQPFDCEAAKVLHSALGETPQLASHEHRRFCAERMLAGWLPVDQVVWDAAPPEALEAHRKELKDLRLNATLKASGLDATEIAKDERLVRAIAWATLQLPQTSLRLDGVDLAAHKDSRSARKRPVDVGVDFAEAVGRLQTLEGPVDYVAGDAILTGTDGERWPVRREVFERTYEPAGTEGRFRKRPLVVRVLRLDEPFSVAIGRDNVRLTGKSRDWLVQYGPGEYGIVSAGIFNRTYELLD